MEPTEVRNETSELHSSSLVNYNYFSLFFQSESVFMLEIFSNENFCLKVLKLLFNVSNEDIYFST